MTAAIRIRRAIGGRLGLAVLPLVIAAVLAPSPAAGAEPAPSPNLLDRPMADLVILAGPDAETTPMLLVLDGLPPSSPVARLAVLRRDAVWVAAASRDIDLGADDLTARWLVDLGEGRFALVASSPQSANGTGHAVVVGLTVDAGARPPRIDEVNRQAFDRAIEDGGAADVDGFGSDELVLGLRPNVDAGSCGTSTLVVVDGSIGAVRRSIDIEGPRGAGVLGRFDAVPGEELLVYASAGCPPGGDLESRLVSIRLADGSRSSPIDGVMPFYPTAIPPPLLLDLDGSAPDEVIAMGRDGLSVFDPSDAEQAILLAGIGSVPLVSGPSGRDGLPGVRVGILDGAGAGALVTARLRRDKAGAFLWEGRSEMAAGAMDPLRWSILTSSIQTAATHQSMSSAWIGDAVDAACSYVVLPGAILPCGTDDLRSGAAWLATRPVATMPIGRQRVILIAAGVEWQPQRGLPVSPTPAAVGPAGWWRHGPSALFLLSEVRSNDLLYFREFPTPAATIEATAAKDGTTALPGFTGARLFTSTTPLEEGVEGPAPAADALVGLTSPPGAAGRTAVVRVPVPPGIESGRDGSFARLTVGDLLVAGGQPTSRWAVHAIAINDWGEWGQPAAQTVTRDALGPTVAVELPFMSPIWPFYAHLAGRSEPDSTVRVDGIGDVEVDSRGRFVIDARLAPWPQDLRVTATDPAGNTTIDEFSVVGGVDYRRFPWPGIAAASLLTVVALRGLFGGGRKRRAGVEATRWSVGALDDASVPEIEELPPGSGLARG